jgi:hypothetical protein
VAQPGRALAWGARGRQFKSARPDQQFSYLPFRTLWAHSSFTFEPDVWSMSANVFSPTIVSTATKLPPDGQASVSVKENPYALRYGVGLQRLFTRLGMHLDIGLLMHSDHRWAGSIPQFFKGVADHPWGMERRTSSPAARFRQDPVT